MHIPPHRLLPQDMVEVFDHGPAIDRHLASVKVYMHASDAKHAMSIEPDRWSLDPVKVDADPEPEHLTAGKPLRLHWPILPLNGLEPRMLVHASPRRCGPVFLTQCY